MQPEPKPVHRERRAEHQRAVGHDGTGRHVEETFSIRPRRFEPAELKVPAGRRVRLVVHNQDSTPEEFESHSLNREKIIPGGAKATLYIGPLKPGRYEFFGEYNPATAKGAVVAE